MQQDDEKLRELNLSESDLTAILLKIQAVVSEEDVILEKTFSAATVGVGPVTVRLDSLLDQAGLSIKYKLLYHDRGREFMPIDREILAFLEIEQADIDIILKL